MRRRNAQLTRDKLQQLGWEVLPQPVYSPDIAPSDFYLFGHSKRLTRKKIAHVDSKCSSSINKIRFHMLSDFREKSTNPCLLIVSFMNSLPNWLVIRNVISYSWNVDFHEANPYLRVISIFLFISCLTNMLTYFVFKKKMFFPICWEGSQIYS